MLSGITLILALLCIVNIIIGSLKGTFIDFTLYIISLFAIILVSLCLGGKAIHLDKLEVCENKLPRDQICVIIAVPQTGDK